MTGREYIEDFLYFIREGKRRSKVVTQAKIQPFCKKHIIYIGCFDGPKGNPTINTERNKPINPHKNNFNLKWKSQGGGFKNSMKEFNLNFKIVDNCIFDKHDKVLFNMHIILNRYNLN